MRNEIICGNNIDILKLLKPNLIDLVVTSPPYDDQRDYNGYEMEIGLLISELKRVLKPGGVIVWIVGDKCIDGTESGTSFKQALLFKEYGFFIHDTMIYMKMPRFPGHGRYAQSFEYMFIFSKGKPKTFNPLKDRLNRNAGVKAHRGRHKVRQKDGTMKTMCREKADDKVREMGNRLNVWYYNNGSGNTTLDKIAFEHPAIYPEKLAEDHILSWSNPGDFILDPFGGSGTTAKMAWLNHRDYLHIDVSEEYCEIARKRLRMYQNRKPLAVYKKEEKQVQRKLF